MICPSAKTIFTVFYCCLCTNFLYSSGKDGKTFFFKRDSGVAFRVSSPLGLRLHHKTQVVRAALAPQIARFDQPVNRGRNNLCR